jgi:hypothetical protein
LLVGWVRWSDERHHVNCLDIRTYWYLWDNVGEFQSTKSPLVTVQSYLQNRPCTSFAFLKVFFFLVFLNPHVSMWLLHLTCDTKLPILRSDLLCKTPGMHVAISKSVQYILRF